MYNIETKKEQPAGRDMQEVAVKRFNAGSQRSQQRLKELNYDPIGEKVRKYWELEEMIKEELLFKTGAKIRISHATGKPMNWYPDFLGKLYDQQLKVAADLLRYGYGRVPEINITEDRKVPPLLIQTTSDMATYHTGGDEDAEEELSD
jgi:hypothetical protein